VSCVVGWQLQKYFEVHVSKTNHLHGHVNGTLSVCFTVQVDFGNKKIKIKNKMRQWSIWWPCGKCGCNKEDVFLSFIFIFLFNYMVSEIKFLTNSMFMGIVYNYLGRGLIGVKKTMQIYGFFVLSPVGVDTCYLAVLGYFFKNK
jgi:hypothetical protein